MKIFLEGVLQWKKTLGIVFFVNAATLLFTFLNWAKIPPLVPLYYGNPTGVEQLSPAKGIFIPPSFVLVALITTILINKAYKDSFLEKLLVLSLCVLTVLSTVTVFKILFLVGNF